MANLNKPIVMAAEFNARFQMFGHTSTNVASRQLTTLWQANNIQILEPDFRTFHGHRNHSIPERVISNGCLAANIYITPGLPAVSDHTPIRM